MMVGILDMMIIISKRWSASPTCWSAFQNEGQHPRHAGQHFKMMVGIPDTLASIFKMMVGIPDTLASISKRWSAFPTCWPAFRNDGQHALLEH
jgi:hypothetical protein